MLTASTPTFTRCIGILAGGSDFITMNVSVQLTQIQLVDRKGCTPHLCPFEVGMPPQFHPERLSPHLSSGENLKGKPKKHKLDAVTQHDVPSS